MNRTSNHDVQRTTISRLTLRLVPFLFLLYVVAYMDRINVGFAKLQMQGQLRFSEEVFGLAFAMFFAGYFFFQVPSNLALARVGARRWIALLMVLWGLVSSSMIFVSTPRSFYVLRFLLGAAEAGFFPGVVLYLKDWFPATARARTVAWFMTAGPISGMIGGPISGALLGLHVHGGFAGWQWLFLLEGLPAIILGGVVLWVLPDTPREVRWISTEQCTWLTETLDAERRILAGTRTNVMAAFSIGAVWLLAFVYFALNACSYGISLWLPTVVRSLSGMSNFSIGVLSAVPYILAAISMVLVGFHSDRTGERRWHVALSAFVGAVVLVAGAQLGTLVPVIVGLSLAMMAVSSMCGPFWAMPSRMLSGAAAAAGIALINSVGNLGGFAGSYILGHFRNSNGGFKSGLFMLGFGLALSGGVALLVRSEVEGRPAQE